MGYRFDDKPAKPEDALRRFIVRNGASLRISFGCWYLEKRPVHKPPSESDLTPIELENEGYDQFAISFEEGEEATDHMMCEIGIDESQGGNVIALRIVTNFPTFHDKPKDFRFTVFARQSGNHVMTDAICHGIITVLPGSPYPNEE